MTPMVLSLSVVPVTNHQCLVPPGGVPKVVIDESVDQVTVSKTPTMAIAPTVDIMSRDRDERQGDRHDGVV